MRTTDNYTDEQMMSDHIDSLDVYYATHPHLVRPPLSIL
jgi:hypothetical protein